MSPGGIEMAKIMAVCFLGLGLLASACISTEMSPLEAWARTRPSNGPSLELLAKGDALYAREKYSEAGRTYARAAEASGPASAYVEASVQVALMWSLVGKPEEGGPWLRMASGRAHRDEPLGWSRLQRVLGLLEREDGQSKVATERFSQLYDYCLAHELFDRAIDAAHQVNLSSSDPEVQVVWSRKALEAAEAGEMTGWLATMWAGEGISLEDQGREEDALIAYEEARKYHDLAGMEAGSRSTETAIGRVLRKLGRIEEAKKISEAVLPWAEEAYLAKPEPEQAVRLAYAVWERAELDWILTDHEPALAGFQRTRNLLVEAKIEERKETGAEELALLDTRIESLKAEME
jgi:tetratricopeptide (TPR) repeat protein